MVFIIRFCFRLVCEDRAAFNRHLLTLNISDMEEMKMFFEQIRKEEAKRSIMAEIDDIVDDFNKSIDLILEKLKEKK